MDNVLMIKGKNNKDISKLGQEWTSPFRDICRRGIIETSIIKKIKNSMKQKLNPDGACVLLCSDRLILTLFLQEMQLLAGLQSVVLFKAVRC